MLELYFCPRAVARLRAAPDADLLKAFLDILHPRGHPRSVVQTYVRIVKQFLQHLRRRKVPLASISEITVRAFACRGRRRSPRPGAHAALRHFLRLLRTIGLASVRSAHGPNAVEKTVAAFDAHLRDLAGLAPTTRLYRCRYAREFLQFTFGDKSIGWSRVNAADVYAFIAEFARSGRSAAARVGAVSLRSFFRWLRFSGQLDRDLSMFVPQFRCWRHAGLPTGLSDESYRAVLASFDRSLPVGSRDFALTVCLGDLGLRAGEVASLTLDDLDESAGTLRIKAGKSRRGRVLPLPSRVHAAIAAYVRRDRPDSQDQHLFLRHRAPVGARVTHSLIRAVIRRAFAKVPGCEGWNGTHVLRHTAATRMHRAGADLKRIADVLGHRSLDTTALYAKVDVDRLAAVALPWPGAKEGQP
jgi:site-specific recombinase XerD